MILGLMVVAFAVVVVQRHRIRVQWFISRLDHVESHVDRLNLVHQISAEMAASDGTLEYVARHPSAELRILAVPHAASIQSREGLKMLATLMADESRDVREAAALALVFDEREMAWRILREAAVRKNPYAAGAAAGVLGRSPRKEAACVLAETLREHDIPVVRAQAAESLVMLIVGARSSEIPDMSEWMVRRSTLPDDCEVFLALANATGDDVAFNERLVHEREIANALRAAQANGIAMVDMPETDSPPGTRTIGLLVRTMIHDELGCSFESFSADPLEFAQRLRACVEAANGD